MEGMRLKRLDIAGFKSFAKKTSLVFDVPVTAVVGPNGSGKSNVAEAFRWVLGEQSLKSLRGRRGEDLIFNGGPAGTGRLGRASVAIVFDNTDKKFNVDFPEVTVTREVGRDGVNDYLLNGSRVRLRDIQELLFGVSLGASSHHIVSQGDADRVLQANGRERRELIEDALGLRVYQWKVAESEKKLERTEENITQVTSLQKEIAPHLKFLKKQVEKIERAADMRRELGGLYREYLAREASYLAAEAARLDTAKAGPAAKLALVERKLAAAGRQSAPQSNTAGLLTQAEATVRAAAAQEEDLLRRVGRLEGMIEGKREVVVARSADAEWRLDPARLDAVRRELDQYFAEGETAEAGSLRTLLRKIKSVFESLFATPRGSGETDVAAQIKQLEREHEALGRELRTVADAKRGAESRVAALRVELAAEAERVRESERDLYVLQAEKSQLQAALQTLRSEAERLAILKADFERELKEGAVLVNQEILRYAEESFTGTVDRADQDRRRREIEKLKIRLEDMGAGETDVLEEYKKVSEREEFLTRELGDLETSKAQLRTVIAELREKLDAEFRDGLQKINTEFQHFFSLLFGGGTAALALVKGEKPKRLEDDDDAIPPPFGETTEADGAMKDTIEIKLNLPRKRIRALEMLSGGERALTSIALLFAMSQVNPPPFLILDETDAALDEANSKKYGDMIAELSKRSQLILITHNRETMGRAGVLYGITMGADGISRLLSLRFEDAAQWAK